MALDEYNLKLQRVPFYQESAFRNYSPDRGEIHFRAYKKYVSIGDGVKKGGHVLASKQQVLDAIRTVEETDNYDKIELE